MARKKQGTAKKAFLAFFFMLFGGLLMMVLVLAFNKPVPKKEPTVKQESRYVKMEKQLKQATKPKPKPKPEPKKAPPKAPLPNLNANLGGIEMDIPEFSTDSIGGDATELLDEIAEDTIMTGNSVDVQPKVLSRSAMEYPASAMKNRIKGYVIVNVLIDKQGNVETAQVLEAFPSGIFDAVALNGVRSWRFSPAQYKGQAVKVWAKQKVRFDFN